MDCWRKDGRLGVLSITVPEQYGGIKDGLPAHMVAMEEISGQRFSEPVLWFAHSNLCVNQINHNGTTMPKKQKTPKLISGGDVGALWP